MARIYALNAISMNGGRHYGFGYADWRENSLCSELRAGYAYGDYFHVLNALFDQTELAALANKTITSIVLNVTVTSGQLPTSGSENLPIGHKANANTTSTDAWQRTKTGEDAAISVGFVTGGGSSAVDVSTPTVFSFDVGTEVPQYGYVFGSRDAVNRQGFVVSAVSMEVTTNEPSGTTFTVSYNKGSNGTGTNTSDTKTDGVPLTLRGALFSRSGYTQYGWATEDGGPKVYELGGLYTADADITLYPAWSQVTYEVAYNKGTNGTGTNATDTKAQGIDLILRGAIFTRTGYTQDGWSTTDGGAKAYNLGGTYSTDAPITLYPHWSTNTYTITLRPGSNGTGSVQTLTKTYGETLTLPGAIFTRPGYVQDGWSTTDGGEKAYDLEGSYTTNSGKTLYPHWKRTSIMRIKSGNTMAGGTIYVKKSNQMKLGVAYVKRNGQIVPSK